MELYQLKTFVAVAEEGLLTRAAERLHSSQPAISAHIKALESELGLQLFDRTPKGMRLTAEGELLKIKAQSIIEATADLSYTARTLQGIPSGDVRLGLHTDPILLRIADILTEFQVRHPQLSVNYVQKMSWQAPKEVALGNLDAAFMYTRPEDTKLEVLLLDQVQLVIVAPREWQSRLKNVHLGDLVSFPWVWTDERCPLFRCATTLFSESGQEPLKAVIVDQESAILKLVSSGVGLSLMPEEKARRAALDGQLYILDIPAPNLDLSLIYLKSRKHDPVVRTIVDIVEDVWQAPQSNKESERITVKDQVSP